MERGITPQKKGYTDERDGSARAVSDGAGRISEAGAKGLWGEDRAYRPLWIRGMGECKEK
jgi:hypothetical protein